MVKINSILVSLILVLIYLFIPEKTYSQSGEVFAAVKKGANWGYIDTTGKVRIPFSMAFVGSFSEGFANVKYGGDWGYIDKKGTFKLKPYFISANPFNDGRALVSFFEPKDSVNYHGYINRHGYLITVLQTWESSLNDYHDGYAKIKSKTNTGIQFGYKDSLDSFAIKPQYNEAGDFYEGKAAVKIGTKWGYIDEKGKLLIPQRFEAVWPFKDQIGEVRASGKIGIVDKGGVLVVRDNFLSHGEAPEQRGLEHKEGKWGYLDEKGKLVITGREKDIIINKGFKIYPQEVENIISSYPLVIRVGVVGIPDEAAGQIPVAYVQLRENDPMAEKQIRELCVRSLAAYKIPRYFYCSAENLPITATGKVDKKKLGK